MESVNKNSLVLKFLFQDFRGNSDDDLINTGSMLVKF